MLNRPKSSRRVLFELMKEPGTKKALAEKTGLAEGTVDKAISDLRKNNVEILAVGSYPNYRYEYGGRHATVC